MLLIPTLADADANQEIDKLLKSRQLSRELLYEYAKVKVPLDPEGGAQGVFEIYPPKGLKLGSLSLDELRNDEGKLDGEVMLKFLKAHEAEPWDALEVLEKARLKAATSNKRLFVHLGAPW